MYIVSLVSLPAFLLSFHAFTPKTGLSVERRGMSAEVGDKGRGNEGVLAYPTKANNITSKP